MRSSWLEAACDRNAKQPWRAGSLPRPNCSHLACSQVVAFQFEYLIELGVVIRGRKPKHKSRRYIYNHNIYIYKNQCKSARMDQSNCELRAKGVSFG